MRIESELGGDVLTLRVAEDRLDAAVATAFKDSVRGCLVTGGRTVILDISQVGFMDSSGLGAMIAVLKSFPGERRLLLRGLSPNVWRVFRLTRMDRVFDIIDDAPAEAGARKGATAPWRS